MADYALDAGLILPYASRVADCDVLPFADCADVIRERVRSVFLDEWGALDPVAYASTTFIEDNWKGTDVVYVMVDDEGHLVGIVAIDRKNFYPSISHLYVVSERRNQGIGSLLLAVAEKYALYLSFTVVKLWCDETMTKFYETRGYERDDVLKQPGQIIMTKTIMAFAPGNLLNSSDSYAPF